jgi:hypothetical protein
LNQGFIVCEHEVAHSTLLVPADHAFARLSGREIRRDDNIEDVVDELPVVLHGGYSGIKVGLK